MTTIKAYPETSPIEFADLADFVKAFKQAPPVISEFTFTNLYAWRNVYKFSVSSLDGMLLVCSNKDDVKRFFSPIGKGDVRAAIEKVINDTGGTFIRLPEQHKRLFDGDSRFIIEPDRDNADYLYNSSDLTGLAGKKYDGKRNLIKKFKSENAYEYMRLDADCARLCLDFEKLWCSIRNCERVEGLSNERLAIREMIDNFSAFSLVGGAIKVKSAVCAIAIAERLNPDTLVVHVLKAVPGMPGLYQSIMQEFLSSEAVGLRYVNLEQDLGIGGLRKAKLSYHPCAMIDKYTLKLKGNG